MATAPGIHIHRAPLPPAHLGAAGITAARTVVDVAREHGAWDAIVIADAALAESFTNLDEIHQVLTDCAGWPGIRQAREVLQLTSHLAESPLESVSRLIISRMGLPRPTPQVQIRDVHGKFLGRVDFYWDEFGVVGEVDGKSKYETSEVVWREKRRQESLEDTGLVVVRWGLPELRKHVRLRQKLTSGFARAQLRAPEARRWQAVSLARVR